MNAEEAQVFMTNLIQQIDQVFNGPDVKPDSPDKQVGFIMLVFPLKQSGGCTIATNGIRKEDAVEILKIQADLLAPKQ